MDPKTHWERVYRDTEPDELSWYQDEPEVSLSLIRRAAKDKSTAIMDVGGGASKLVDHLLASGYRRITVLDLSSAALAASRARLGRAGSSVRWLEADVLRAIVQPGTVDLWHDRAVFHFLTDPADRRRYVAQVRQAVAPGGHVLVATFAPDGPSRCSGLEVARYSAKGLHAEFGAGFSLRKSVREEHRTPAGRTQAFTYCLCRTEDAVPGDESGRE